MKYLVNLTDDIINEHGLAKVFYVRKEIIHIKHILKKFFVAGYTTKLEKTTDIILQNLNMSYFQYIEFICEKIRFINKVPRTVTVENATKLIGKNWKSAKNMLKLYSEFKPIVLIDFNEILNNEFFNTYYFKKFINMYNIIIINTNTTINADTYIKNIYKTSKINIIQRKNKTKKIHTIKDIACKNVKFPIFYFDTDEVCLNYGNFLFMHTYKINNKKITKFSGKK